MTDPVSAIAGAVSAIAQAADVPDDVRRARLARHLGLQRARSLAILRRSGLRETTRARHEAIARACDEALARLG